MTARRRPGGGWGGIAGVAAFALLALWCGYQLAFSEIIAVADGLGFDGQFYGRLALAIARGEPLFAVDAYRMGRVAPSLLVGGVLRLLGAGETRDVVLAFRLLTAAELLAAMAVWIRIAALLRITGRAFALATALLFANFAVALNSFYYPVSTDTTALLLGLGLGLAYLRGAAAVLAVLGVVGAFVWPVCGPVAALALAFPYRTRVLPSGGRVGAVAGALAALAIVLAGAGVVFVLGRTRMGLGPVAEIEAGLIWPSLAAHAALIGGGLAVLGRRLPVTRPRAALGFLDARSLALAAAVLLLPRLVTLLVASPGPPLLSTKTFAAMIAFLPLVRPATMPVSHFAYFGLLVPMAMLLWPGIVRAAARGGLGPLVLLGFALVIALTPESRQSMLTLSAVAIPLGAAMRDRCWPLAVVAALVAAQVALVLLAGPQNAGADPGAPGIDQLPGYFARQGPYMPFSAYREHLTVFAAGLAAVIAALWFSPTRRDAAPSSSAAGGRE